MNLLRRTIAVSAAVCLMTAAAFAADASGTWKWNQPSRGSRTGGGDSGKSGTPREVTLTLTQKGGNLTGQMSMPGRDGNASTTEIQNGKVSGDTVSFTVERQFGDNKFVTKYSGKLSGDTITGESESPGRNGGEAQKREWVAKRAK